MISYLKRWIKALKMIGPGTTITTQQVASKITNHTFIVILETEIRKEQMSEAVYKCL